MTANLAGLNNLFAARLSAAIAAAEKATGAKADFVSGRRTAAQGVDIWNRATGGGRHAPSFPAARPGRSLHEQGMAVDMPAGPIRDWVQKHAKEYGLEPANAKRGFGWDAPHIQLARGVPKTSYDSTPSLWAGDGQKLPPENIPNVGPAADQPARTLRKGMSGPDVAQLGGQLGSLGYNTGTPSDRFGPQTQAAVRQFERGTGGFIGVDRRGREAAGPQVQGLLADIGRTADINDVRALAPGGPAGASVNPTDIAFDRAQAQMPWDVSPAPGGVPPDFSIANAGPPGQRLQAGAGVVSIPTGTGGGVGTGFPYQNAFSRSPETDAQGISELVNGHKTTSRSNIYDAELNAWLDQSNAHRQEVAAADRRASLESNKDQVWATPPLAPMDIGSPAYRYAIAAANRARPHNQQANAVKDRYAAQAVQPLQPSAPPTSDYAANRAYAAAHPPPTFFAGPGSGELSPPGDVLPAATSGPSYDTIYSLNSRIDPNMGSGQDASDQAIRAALPGAVERAAAAKTASMSYPSMVAGRPDFPAPNSPSNSTGINGVLAGIGGIPNAIFGPGGPIMNASQALNRWIGGGSEPAVAKPGVDLYKSVPPAVPGPQSSIGGYPQYAGGPSLESLPSVTSFDRMFDGPPVGPQDNINESGPPANQSMSFPMGHPMGMTSDYGTAIPRDSSQSDYGSLPSRFDAPGYMPVPSGWKPGAYASNNAMDFGPAGGEPAPLTPRGPGYVTMQQPPQMMDAAPAFFSSPPSLDVRIGGGPVDQAKQALQTAATQATGTPLSGIGGPGYSSGRAPWAGPSPAQTTSWINSYLGSSGVTPGPYVGATSPGYTAPNFNPISGGATYAYRPNGNGGGTYVDSHGNVHSY